MRVLSVPEAAEALEATKIFYKEGSIPTEMVLNFQNNQNNLNIKISSKIKKQTNGNNNNLIKNINLMNHLSVRNTVL